MKLLWITNKDVTTEPIVASLDYCAEDLGVTVDKRYYTHYCSYDVDGYDAIIYMGGAELKTTPSFDAFREMRKQAKVVMICCDASCGEGWGPLLEIYHNEKTFDFIVNIDGSDNWKREGKDYTAITPIDPRYFEGALPWKDRPVLFGFSGGINDNRRSIMKKISMALTINARSEEFGSYPAYANFLKQCKFVLNMNERNTVKGRTLEVGLAGACLVEQRWRPKNTFSTWFDESQYILYDDSADICELIFDNMDKGADMAKRFSTEVREKHNAKLFWKKVLETL